MTVILNLTKGTRTVMPDPVPYKDIIKVFEVWSNPLGMCAELSGRGAYTVAGKPCRETFERLVAKLVKVTGRKPGNIRTALLRRYKRSHYTSWKLPNGKWHFSDHGIDNKNIFMRAL
jgi:hypothetical protein